MADVTAQAESFRTRGGITVHRTIDEVPITGAVEPILEALDSHRGVLLASSYEYPGRYTRWDIGFIDPPLALTARGRHFQVVSLNVRGFTMLPWILEALTKTDAVTSVQSDLDKIWGTVSTSPGRFAEEERSKQPSIFSVVRAVSDLFASPDDEHLGLYGAFGYDLAFQFEPLRLRLEHGLGRDMVLYLPDELLIVDHRRERALRRSYDFELGEHATRGGARGGESVPYVAADRVEHGCDHAPGEYAEGVRRAHAAFRRGDLFEVTPSQTFFEPCAAAPSEVFRRLRQRNPAPYGFLVNLGEGEYLVGASPEMYVRVDGDRVETCPIAGTIARGADAIGDAAQIRQILNSPKDESELTMCTDVDRNDKSRICVPGSVKVIGRRQIEMYSRLIHTVDHVEGRLRPEFDGLDAFLSHTWAVTVTGAPKAWAMQFIEDNEKSPRAWYGGAVGLIGFDGHVNTGLTLRTIRIKDGIAEIRAGATLLYDSDPDEEERETRIKASALVDAIRRPPGVPLVATTATAQPGKGKRLLFVDHQDSFVHTLANYFRQTGAEVVTLRAGFDPSELDRIQPHLLVLSPGPGTPTDFQVPATIAAAVQRKLPVFGVCLGLQGMVEYFGGKLGVLDYPMHGKPSQVNVGGGRIFQGLPRQFVAGRYHSLFALRDVFPAVLQITAESDDGCVMAIEHPELPMAAVQFHPESILTLADDIGMRLIQNVVATLAR